MNRKQELNAFIKECITKALIELMKKKDFEDITITELVETAGVGRVSFYRNFESKKDVLQKYLQEIWYRWRDDYEEHNVQPNFNSSYFIESILNHFYQNKDFNLLLYRHGMSELIYEVVRWGAKIEESENNIQSYIKSMIAGLVFGIIDEWIRRGMQETPEQIFALASQISNKSSL